MAIVVFTVFNNFCALLVPCRRIDEQLPRGEVKWLKPSGTTMTRYLNAHITRQLVQIYIFVQGFTRWPWMGNHVLALTGLKTLISLLGAWKPRKKYAS